MEMVGGRKRGGLIEEIRRKIVDIKILEPEDRLRLSRVSYGKTMTIIATAKDDSVDKGQPPYSPFSNDPVDTDRYRDEDGYSSF